MATIRNYGVGTGYSSSGVTGKRSTFEHDQKIYAVHVWDNLSGGEPFRIEFARLVGTTWERITFRTWINPSYTSALQNSWIQNHPPGKYRASFWAGTRGPYRTEFTVKPKEEPEPPPPPPPPEYPKNIIRGIYTITVDNIQQEVQAKEFLGIDPPGDDLDTWLSQRDLIQLEQWKNYWTNIFSTIGMAFWEGFVNDKFEEYLGKFPGIGTLPPPEPPPELTWWEKLLKLVSQTPLFQLTTSEIIFKAAYESLTGRAMTDQEFKLKEMELFDWILPINAFSKLITGQNLKGESEEFGSANDYLDMIFTVAAIIPGGKVAATGAKLAIAKISAAEAAGIVSRVGEKVAVSRLKKVVLNHPETSSKFLASFPVAVREAVIKGLYGTAAGREAIFALGKMGYFREILPWWKKILTNAGMVAGIAGLFVTSVGSYPFAGFIKEEALQNIDFAIKAATDNKDIEGLRRALDEKAELLDTTVWEKILAAIPFANVLAQLRDFYDAAKIKLKIDEDGFEAKKEEWIEEAMPTGRLIIRAEPSGSKIEVQGQFPTTNVFDAIIPIGTYSWTVSKFGFVSESGVAEVKEEEITELDLEIFEEPEEPPEELPPEEVVGKLTISAIDSKGSEEGIVIEIAGQPEITIPGSYNLSPGSYTVRVSKEEFISQIKTAFVSDKKDTVVSFILEEVEPPEELPTKATVEITSEPSASDIYIDGDYTFTKTPFTTVLDPGTYIIRVQQDGYFPQEASVTISKGDEIIVPFLLEEIPEAEAPTVEYLPQEPWYPTYVPPTYYTPQVSVTPYSQVSVPNYSLLAPPSFRIAQRPSVSTTTDREVMINIETTDAKPWKGKIFSIAWLDLSMPEAEPQVIVDDNEEEILKAFIDLFETSGFTKITGFKTIFDYRFIFNKIMLYRMQSKAFYDAELRDVKQLLDQVKEEFVYFPDKTGKLDDYGKELLGVGKYGTQQALLRRYIAGDFSYVERFQLQQIQVTKGLYDLFRFSAAGSSISTESAIPKSTSPILNPVPGIEPGPTHTKKCISCLAEQPVNAEFCDICKVKL